jgi:deazaflavin-dependent oxidoreductase (nitroreductase family)
LIGIPDGEKIILIASNFGRAQHPGWYHNLKANPQATLYWRGQSGKYLAREATESERQHYWQMAERIYIGFPLYKQRAGERRIPIVVLSPEDPNDSAKGNP